MARQDTHAGMAVAPVVALGMAQRGQIAWIPHLGERWLAEQIATEQFFHGVAGWVVGGWLLAAAGLLRLVRTQPRTAAVLADRTEPDDGLITFAPLMTVAENVYPEPMARIRLLNDDPDSPWLTAAIYPRMGGPLAETLTVPDDVRRIWYLSERTSRDWRTSDPDADADLLEERGFRPTGTAGPEGYDDLVITLPPTGLSPGSSPTDP